MISLPTVLRLNAWFSIVSGAGLALGATLLDEAFGVDAIWLVAVGVGVVLFGVAVRGIAAGVPVDRRAALGVLLADAAWVVGAAVLIFAFPDLLTVAGKWTLGIISVFVLDFVTLEAVALSKS